MTLVILIRIDSHLHTPMYFFIGNLSFLDFWYTSVYTPRILATCVSEDKRLSLAECGAQLFFSCVVAYTECFLLAAMAYDRHMAICNPLLYSSSMSPSLCTRLVAGSYIGGFLNAIAHTANTFCLSFCGKNIIDHFFCDAPPLVKMSCTDTKVYEEVLLGFVGFTVLLSILVIIISYFHILLAILRIRTASGRRKAFSTCASHVVSVRSSMDPCSSCTQGQVPPTPWRETKRLPCSTLWSTHCSTLSSIAWETKTSKRPSGKQQRP